MILGVSILQGSQLDGGCSAGLAGFPYWPEPENVGWALGPGDRGDRTTCLSSCGGRGGDSGSRERGEQGARAFQVPAVKHTLYILSSKASHMAKTKDSVGGAAQGDRIGTCQPQGPDCSSSHRAGITF